MTLTTDEAIQVLEAIRNCLYPRRVRYGADWRKDKALLAAEHNREFTEIRVYRVPF